jgi:hypothetical protein
LTLRLRQACQGISTCIELFVVFPFKTGSQKLKAESKKLLKNHKVLDTTYSAVPVYSPEKALAFRI